MPGIFGLIHCTLPGPAWNLHANSLHLPGIIFNFGFKTLSDRFFQEKTIFKVSLRKSCKNLTNIKIDKEQQQLVNIWQMPKSTNIINGKFNNEN